jgi:hypothetical protein
LEGRGYTPARTLPIVREMIGMLMRMMIVGVVTLVATAAWGFAPDCNVTRGIYIHYRHLIPEKVWANWGTTGARATRWSKRLLIPVTAA